MPHPIMFRDDDPGLAEVRKLALSFHEAFEKVSWGRPGVLRPEDVRHVRQQRRVRVVCAGEAPFLGSC
jgi:hypothetical protein